MRLLSQAFYLEGRLYRKISGSQSSASWQTTMSYRSDKQIEQNTTKGFLTIRNTDMCKTNDSGGNTSA